MGVTRRDMELKGCVCGRTGAVANAGGPEGLASPVINLA